MNKVTNINFNVIEKIVRHAQSNCCPSKSKLEVMINCNHTDRQCETLAVCPSCSQRFQVKDIVNSQNSDLKNSIVICDSHTRSCSIVPLNTNDAA